jgi:hypothetical protein
MAGEAGNYFDGLREDVARRLGQANQAGLSALREYLASGEAVAFLGAGASAPLYPLWPEVVGQMIDAAQARGLLCRGRVHVPAGGGGPPARRRGGKR